MNKEHIAYDAVIVGSGPNGLAAAITMQQAGLSVLLVEGKDTIGGGMRTAELTLPGFKHDVCSAIHPMAVASPFFASLPLQEYGLEFIQPGLAAAHPFDDGTAAFLSGSMQLTAAALGKDEQAYLDLIGPLVQNWEKLVGSILSPLKFPQHPLLLAGFGLKALQSAEMISKRFSTEKAKGLWAGMTAHSIQPLSNLATAAIGMVLSAVGHVHGWPIPKGGSQSVANALAGYFVSLGGKIQTGQMVKSLDELPKAKTVLLDLTPKQLLEIAPEKFSALYKWQLGRYRYGMGVFKIDWALSSPIPFTAAECLKAGTVHIGNTFGEIAGTEQRSANDIHAEKPFVLLAQPSVFDGSRAPSGKHTAWAYCHVPNGSRKDMTEAIEKQVERFAPGFRDTILDRHTMNTAEVEAYNPNYIGGDINGGIIDLSQLYTRPALRISPYRTSAKGIYICSSSTPPGGGVHGMCGYYAAKQALADIFNLKTPNLNS
ncbi:phytoene desaturase family protein [Pedobacter hartonius]|uniref:Phytoene dehydrogenase-related protein n=1 Tax=Pedobacter hartonius TaxID=425514 RepID=A0A1H4AKG7_9SPHI|nr:NAD(P)/FAD-dependent oxidoreductase [Pedobacter hartonius]SEA36415.1 Phytoene dehydrogenase-related protein [Pedobacter hartonius]